MKLTTRIFSLLAIALVAGTGFGVRAEEQPGYPVQVEIEARQIHATHSLRNLNCPPAPAPVVHQETLPMVLFNVGSDKLSPAAKADIKKVAELLKSPANKNKNVLVGGYTDNTGKPAYNQRLSFHRAKAVVKELVKDGVPASRLKAEGFGKENPVDANTTPEGRALNRRVAFTLSEPTAQKPVAAKKPHHKHGHRHHKHGADKKADEKKADDKK